MYGVVPEKRVPASLVAAELGEAAYRNQEYPVAGAFPYTPLGSIRRDASTPPSLA